jgi:hypothetical protein
MHKKFPETSSIETLWSLEQILFLVIIKMKRQISARLDKSFSTKLWITAKRLSESDSDHKICVVDDLALQITIELIQTSNPN